MILLAILSIFFSTALAAQVSHDLAVHESLASIPTGYTSNGPASADSVLNLRFNLAARNISGLQSILYEISTPGNANYGNHLTQDELAAYVKPTSQATLLMRDWLSSHNLTGTSASFSGEFIEVALPVSKANALLNADFHLYTAPASGRRAIRAVSYSIPVSLKGHLDNIHPTVNFPVSPSSTTSTGPASSMPSSNSTSSLPESCHTVTTPACIQDLYGIPLNLATQPTNKLFVSGFQGQYANQADITTFLATFRPDLASNTSFAFISIANGTDTQNRSEAGVEADLDMQYTMGLASGVPVTFVSVGPNLTEITSLDDFFIAFQNEANYLLALETPPTVLTSSYGLNEGYVTSSLANTICNLYMQLGARGVSVIFSSGDAGVGGSCTNEPFLPVFPGTCPYVTSVGSTQLDPTGLIEIGANFGNGAFPTGGFSNYFPMPSYQLSQVSSYISGLGSTYAGLYNNSGRGFPDASALGVNYTLVWEQGTIVGSGTSCSAPTFASVIALLNDQLIGAGMSPLGFLNPWLYSANGTAALTDILIGDNPGCGTNGFNATAGWDPVTGLGTPVFSKLLAAAGL